MAINYDNTIPEWKNEGVEPSDELKENGFQGGYRPPATVFNWFWSLVQKCITELQETLSDVNTTVKDSINTLSDSLGAAAYKEVSTSINSTDTDDLITVSGVKDAIDDLSLAEIDDTTAYVKMTAAERTKLSGIATGATKITVDSALNSTSTNPVQNKVVYSAIDELQDDISSLEDEIVVHAGTGTGAIIANNSANTASGYGAVAFGGYGATGQSYENTVSGSSSSCLAGFSNSISGNNSSNAAGNKNTIEGAASCTIGAENTVSGNGSLATGYQNTVSSNYSSCLAGYSNKVSGSSSGCLAGYSNSVSSDYSSCLAGYENTVSGNSSSCLAGNENKIETVCSSCVAGTYNTVTKGGSSFAAGYNNTVSSMFSCAVGVGLIAQSTSGQAPQAVFGQYNEESDGCLIVGSGNEGNRSNAFRVSGKTCYANIMDAQSYQVNGTDIADYIIKKQMAVLYGGIAAEGAAGENATAYLCQDGSCFVTGSGDMVNDGYMASINSEFKAAAEKAVVSDGITSICASAFSGYKKLTNVIIPSSVTSIGNYAFYYCTSLPSITIPASVTSIGEKAFGGCTNLTTITINKAEDSIEGAPWGATNATVVWTGK